MKKTLIIGAACIVLGAAGYFGWSALARDASEPSTVQTPTPSADATEAAESDPEPQADQTRDSIRITAVGDMLPHDTVNLRAKTDDGYDYIQFFEQSRQQMQGDIVFCNQESPSAGTSFGITGYPTFNAPTEFARDLNEVGCNVIGLANNHLADKGAGAIDATLDYWDTLEPLAVAGANRTAAEQNEIAYFEVAGKTFAFLAFTDHQNNNSLSSFRVNEFSAALVEQLVGEAATNSDYVLVSAHWGTENAASPSSAQVKWATALSDAGADFVFGSGPHVIQTVDKIGETYVAYSLGNFLSTQLTIEQLIGGVLIIDIPLGEGEPELSFTPTFMNYSWTAAQRDAQDLLARHNLELIPLDQADQALAASLFSTTADRQEARLSDILNQNINVKIVY